MSRRFVDLSHPIVAGMTTYPGLPGPEIETFIGREESASRLAPGVSFHIGRICMVANTGTYLDAPFHFFSSGADTAGLPLERLVDLRTVVVDARGDIRVEADRLRRATGHRWRCRTCSHRLVPSLGHGPIRGRQPTSEPRRRPVADRSRSGPCRHRRPEHRRRERPRAAGSCRSAGSRYPDHRAHDEPSGAAGGGSAADALSRRPWSAWARCPCGPSPRSGRKP